MPDVNLRDDEIARIAARLGREPTAVELRAFEAQWSEHCSYKSSRRWLRTLPTTGEAVIVGVGEDAGVVRFGEHAGERYGIVIAHESHNHPSQVVPFEGAATGVGGIVRDVLCMGARVIGIADALRLGDVSDPRSHQRYVARGVVDGIAAYGNAIGVPNVAGDAYFDHGFNDNCLVNVIALGLVKEREIVHSRAPRGSAGWDLVLVGKATDRSGFGGASFSSATLDARDRDANKGAVQVPDPFLKNVVMRASYRVFEYLHERGIEAGFKDLGAGGIMGCSAELCAAGGYGAMLDLDAVNVAAEDMLPEVIAIGETQERLLWVLPPSATAEVLRIYNEEFSLPDVAYNARACVIGVVTEERRYVLRHRDAIVMDVDVDFLTGAIEEDLPHVAESMTPQRAAPPAKRHPVDDDGATPWIPPSECSLEPLYRRYDAVVRGATVLPRGRGDAGVLAPIPGSKLGVALAVAGDPALARAGARAAAAGAVREAVWRVVAVGATPLALTDCLNCGNPQNPQQYGAFIAAVEGLGAAARAYELPFVSGNVSLYNASSDGTAVPAGAIVACVGRLDDVARVVTPALKRAGSALLFVPAFARNVAEVLDAMSGEKVLSTKVVRAGDLRVAAARMIFAAGMRLGVALNDAAPNAAVTTDDSEQTTASGEDASVLNGDGVLLEVMRGTTLPGASEVGETIAEPVLRVGERAFSLKELHAAWKQSLAEIYP